MEQNMLGNLFVLQLQTFQTSDVAVEVCVPRLAGAGVQVRGVPQVSRFFASAARSNGLLGVRLRQQPASAGE